jgi:hypothetical protein
MQQNDIEGSRRKILREIMGYRNASCPFINVFNYIFEYLIKEWDVLLDKYGIDVSEMYGCGSFGCAFPTLDPKWSFKITHDKNEIDYLNLGADLSDEYSFFPKVGPIEMFDPDIDLVKKLNLSGDMFYVYAKRMKLFYVMREPIIPISDLYNRDFREILNDSLSVLRGAWIYGYENAESVFEKDERFRLFFDDLIRFKENHSEIEISDVRYYNIGISELDGRVVLFDGQVNEI